MMPESLRAEEDAGGGGFVTSTSTDEQHPRFVSTDVGREGCIVIRNTQRSVSLSVADVEAQLRRMLELVNCAHMDVGLWLASDASVR